MSYFLRSVLVFTTGLLTGSIVVASVPWIMLERGASPSLAAFLVAAPLVGFVASGVLMHRIIDRTDLRRGTLTGLSIITVGLLTMIGSEITGVLSIPAAFVLCCSIGMSGQMIQNSTMTGVALRTGHDREVLLRKRHSILNTIGQLAAFGAGSIGVAASGLVSLSVLCGAALMLAATSAWLSVGLPHQERSRDTRPTVGIFRMLVTRASSTRVLWIHIAWNFVLLYAALQSAWLHDTIHASTGDVAVFMVCGGVGNVLAGLLMARVSTSNLKLGTLAIATQGMAIGSYAVTDSIVGACVVYFFIMLCNTTFASVVLNEQVRRADPSLVSSTMNSAQVFPRAAGIITAALSGVAVALTTMPVIFVISAVGVLTVAVWFAATLRRDRAPAAP